MTSVPKLNTLAKAKAFISDFVSDVMISAAHGPGEVCVSNKSIQRFGFTDLKGKVLVRKHSVRFSSG